jgi:UDP-GlcNAc3NAcA epimerase
MKILTIVGARPQFIKAAMVSRAIVEHNQQGAYPPVVEEIIHTGQHYDENMSDIFFNQLQISEPAVNLHAGKGMHGEMTGRMLNQIEKEIVKREPDWVLVYGDTNSTLAGALAAAKLNVPVAHVEAGLRSFNKRMPEEINRILTDHVSSLMFCPTQAAAANLANEGIIRGVHHVGDVMYDAALMFEKIADKKSNILQKLGLTEKSYILSTVHRQENTDARDRLENILRALVAIATSECRLVLPLHPRTKRYIDKFKLWPVICKNKNAMIIEPVSFLDMVQLENKAKVIMTDSGGVQKEAYFHQVPCITLRDESEWIETITAGWNQVAGADFDSILRSFKMVKTGVGIFDYGNGDASNRILDCLVNGCGMKDRKKKSAIACQSYD